MSLIGSDVHDANMQLRLCLIVFCGIIAFGSIVFWKTSLLANAEYQEMPTTHEQLKIKKHNLQEQLMQKQINQED